MKGKTRRIKKLSDQKYIITFGANHKNFKTLAKYSIQIGRLKIPDEVVGKQIRVVLEVVDNPLTKE